MADQFVAHLATVPLFAQCSKHDLVEIARFVDEIEVAEGRELITEGDVGHEAFIVVEGTASVTRGGEPVTDVGPGSVIGEMALIDRAPRNATVTATSPMKLIVVGKREFSGLLDESPKFRAAIMGALAARVREKDRSAFG
jgi:CRP/FNR family transcriptional regulator, cyclic AMP receptor protein